MNLLGSAEMGVSIWFASRFIACGLVLMGGAGLANGFGGPCAPALSSAPALGLGGGRTTPCVRCPPGVTPGCGVFASSNADAVPSPSDCSAGICKFNFGRFASEWFVFCLVGGGTFGTLALPPDLGG